MTTETPNQTLTTYVSDMHALVTHGLTAIDRQVDNLKNEGHPEALAAVQEFQRTLRTHASMLEARVRGLGGSTTQPVKDAVSAVAGLAAGLVNAVRAEEASKSIRDDYTFLSHVAVGYLMLHTTATGLGDRETSALAETGYGDAARLIMHIDRILPTVVLQELNQDGLAVADVAKATQSMVKKSWDREASALPVARARRGRGHRDATTPARARRTRRSGRAAARGAGGLLRNGAEGLAGGARDELAGGAFGQGRRREAGAQKVGRGELGRQVVFALAGLGLKRVGEQGEERRVVVGGLDRRRRQIDAGGGGNGVLGGNATAATLHEHQP